MQINFQPFIFRPAELHDIPAILFLERYCFSPAIAFGHRRWRYLIRSKQIKTYVIYDQEQLVAVLCLLSHRGWQGIEIRCLAVHWNYRRRSLASKLLHLTRQVAMDDGYNKLFLSADVENSAALQLYQKLGFKPSHFQPHYYGWEQHAYRMHCLLNPII